HSFRSLDPDQVFRLASASVLPAWAAWIAGRAAARGWPHLLMLPVYALTFLFGPAGLLAYTVMARLRPSAASTASAAGDTR
ncbi:MAG: hypothetical protein KDG57_22610, partial [Rhodoferax sp.]|nr:hypothetical protein [Rhodoferax sp.]